MKRINLGALQTEARNANTTNIDRLSSLEICQLINSEDATIATAVAHCIPDIAKCVDALLPRIRDGGRLIYVGAGTSGRLGIIDASEIPPTYSAPYSQFIGLIAGGDAAIRRAQEGAEDDVEAGERDLKSLSLRPAIDSIIGIAASGRTPYVLGCLSFARRLGCLAIGLACCDPSSMATSGHVDIMIAPVTGPELIGGSTRMKAGTATKFVLNMISTAVMVRLGKTYGNMMVDLKPSNIKLRQRSINIIRDVCESSTNMSDASLDLLLTKCKDSVKLALAVLLMETEIDDAKTRLAAAGGVLSEAVKQRQRELTQTAGRKLVLCVDGGASSCKAVVMDLDGRFGAGKSGSCNMTENHINTSLSALFTAVEKALSSYAQNSTFSFVSSSTVEFMQVWIGLAGYGRPLTQPLIDSALKSRFGTRLRISNDADLLTSAMDSNECYKSVIVLIAGTGSVGMSYELNDSVFQRTARAGGFGKLLGDEGSGFYIGKRAVTYALRDIDKQNAEFYRLENLEFLTKRVLQHFKISDVQGNNKPDLLGTIYDVSIQQNALPSSIASLAPVVLASASQDEAAASILRDGAKELVRIVELLIGPEKVNPKNSMLILDGGLFSVAEYRDATLNELVAQKISFAKWKVVQDAALTGARYLRDQHDSLSSRTSKL